VRLEPLEVWFQPAAGALLPQLRPFLIAAGQAQAGFSARLLRWAITTAEPARGLRIEAVLMVGSLDDDDLMTGSDPGSGSVSGSDSLPGLSSGLGSGSTGSISKPC
jgi:hypothetical protein